MSDCEKISSIGVIVANMHTVASMKGKKRENLKLMEDHSKDRDHREDRSCNL